jgi:hypothetical protein
VTFWSNHPEYNFQSKTVKLSHFTLEKSFFSFLTNFFFIHIKVAQCCEGSPKNNENPVAYSEHGIWQFSKKKLGTNFFIFTVKHFFHSNLFLLSFGPRVHFRGQKSTFMSNHPEYKFQSKTVKLSYFTLKKSFFFIFNKQKISFILKLLTVARGHQKTMRTGSLIRNMVFGGFPKKIRNKTFYFHSNKFFSL